METVVEPIASPLAEPFVHPLPPSGLSHLAGLLAAAVALGIGELVASLSDDWQSLVISVANVVKDRAPDSVTHWAIETLGTNDKPALIVGTVVITLLLGWFIGPVAARRPMVAVVAFGIFGLLGIIAGLDDPLAGNAGTVITALFAIGAGLTTLFVLLREAAPLAVSSSTAPPPRSSAAVPAALPIESPTNPHATRRSFFVWAGAAGVVAAGSVGLSKSLRGPSKAAQAREQVVLRNSLAETSELATGFENELEGLSSLVTPNDSFYRIDTAIITPQVVPEQWELVIGGMVDTPIVIGYDELLQLSVREYDVTLSCVSNEVGGRLVGNAHWLGVPLADVLDRAGVRAGATQIVGRSVDGWTAGFPTEVAYDGRPAFIAVGMNGEPLPIDHGFPARLVIAGLYGYVSATKWLSEIELTTWEDFDGYWIPRGWSKEGPIKTQSRIDVPRANTELATGPQPIAGVAWAGERAISKVEVQINDDEWQEARLGDQLATTTWRQWVLDWEASPGEHTVRVRATDGEGDTQTDERAVPAPNGATGWDQVNFRVR